MKYKENYEVTMDGQVFSYLSNKWMKQSTSVYGYKFLNIKGPKLVHRLVAICYLPNPNHLPFINHIDGDKTNNCVENLEWCTNSENMKHAWMSGLMKKGEEHGGSKFSEEQVHEVCRYLQEGLSANEVSSKCSFYISRNRVLDIRARRTWKDISNLYSWKKRATTIPKGSRVKQPEAVDTLLRNDIV